jgi:large subunit ribosomal protein L15
MKLDSMKPPAGRKYKRRIARGLGCGTGKTAGKGTKGQKARTGKGKPHPGYEGGQMPMFRRLPKRGFINIFATEYAEVNVGMLQKLEAGTVVTAELLQERNLIKKISGGIRVLGKGDLDKKLTVKAVHVSEGARKKIEQAGGTVEIIS